MRPVIRGSFVAVSVAAGLVAMAWASPARADQLGDVVQKSGVANPNKFTGSLAEVATYVGSGTFYTSGYHNPYVSTGFLLRPTYDLGTKYNLTLIGRFYLETEYTQPDNPVGRHIYPYDPWIDLLAANLHTFERSKITLAADVRVVFPLSYESRYQHMIGALGVGPQVSRLFEFGDVNNDDRKWSLFVRYGFLFLKYAQTSNFRGSGPGDMTGCMGPATPGPAGAAGGGGGEPATSISDHCGGPANPNFMLRHVVGADLQHGQHWIFSISLLVYSTFDYSFPNNALTSPNAVATGQSDTTWGIASVSYKFSHRWAVGAGVSSQQPALDSRYRYPRFPFYDFTGANADTYTQFFLSLDGTL
jgi:hypothetical protein